MADNATSLFAWVDLSESDRQKPLDVINLFREKGTIDELGIGTVRGLIAGVNRSCVNENPAYNFRQLISVNEFRFESDARQQQPRAPQHER